MTTRNSGQLSNRIRERADGRYEARVYMGVDLQGKKIYRSMYGKTPKELKQKIKELTRDGGRPVEGSNMVFREYALHWMKTYKLVSLKPVSYDRLEQTYNKVCEYLGWVQVGSINADDVQRMVNDLSRKKAYSTMKKHFEFVNNVLCHAYNTGEIERNPCNAVVLPKERNMAVKTKQAEVLSREETDAMYELNEKIKASQNQFLKHLPAMLLMLNTGWRVGELLALNWSDVDFKERTAVINKTLTRAKLRDADGNAVSKSKEVHANQTKTGASERITPLNDKAIELLEQIQLYNRRMKIRSKYVVCTKDGGYVSERNLLRTFKSVMGIIGAEKDYTIHSLRHTYASRMLEAGVDVSVVSKLLGHADINVTYKKYIHVDPGHLRQSMENVKAV